MHKPTYVSEIQSLQKGKKKVRRTQIKEELGDPITKKKQKKWEKKNSVGRRREGMKRYDGG